MASKSNIKITQPLLVSLPETRIEKFSRAGKAGSAARWKNHVKLETTLIRVLKNDSYCIGVLARRLHASAADIVHAGLVNWRDSFFVKSKTK